MVETNELAVPFPRALNAGMYALNGFAATVAPPIDRLARAGEERLSREAKERTIESSKGAICVRLVIPMRSLGTVGCRWNRPSELNFRGVAVGKGAIADALFSYKFRFYVPEFYVALSGT